MEEIRIPRPVASLLEWWLLQVRPIFGQKLQGIYLLGGIPLGDFSPKWSDINACVVLETPPTPADAQRISAVHADLQRLFVERRTAEWQSWRGIHCVFLPQEFVQNPAQQSACYVIGDGSGRWSTTDPLSPFERYMLAKSALQWMGQERHFAPPRKEALIAQTERELEALTAEALEHRGALWIACEIQGLARAIAFWRRRRLIGKTEALRREIAQGSPFREQFQFALQLREQGSLGIGAHLALLRTQLKTIAEPASAALRQLLAEARAHVPPAR